MSQELGIEKQLPIAGALKGNAEAVRFMEDIIYVLHLWDDLIDRDKPRTLDDINKAFWIALIDLPRNPFYTDHFHLLNPILMSAIINWHAANLFERGDDEHELNIAFIIRGTYVDLLAMCAYIIGGTSWAQEITPTIRRFAHGETFKGYLNNLALERAERGNHV